MKTASWIMSKGIEYAFHADVIGSDDEQIWAFAIKQGEEFYQKIRDMDRSTMLAFHAFLGACLADSED